MKSLTLARLYLQSLPSRERGLKSVFPLNCMSYKIVAPLAGAWIEILSCLYYITYYYVAPLAGAWIEIIEQISRITGYNVAPLAGAWIEILFRDPQDCKSHVAPLAGAWIEINPAHESTPMSAMSLPSRERGLKYVEIFHKDCRPKSLPSRERGLKLCRGCFSGVSRVVASPPKSLVHNITLM